MKKKCTNSACRRVFSLAVEEGPVRCPHCGKVYPRLPLNRARWVVLRRWTGDVRLIWAMRHYRQTVAPQSSLEVRHLLKGLEDCPVVLGPFSHNRALEVCQGWVAVGIAAEVVDHPGR